MNKPPLVLNADYYINSDGNLVFTTKYLLNRGRCCQSGCTHCPYGHKDKVDPNLPAEFNDAWNEPIQNEYNAEDDDD